METSPNSTLTECPSVVSCGHYGDMLNIFPCLKLLSDKFGRPIDVYMDRYWRSILSCVSYVNPIICDFKYPDIIKTIKGSVVVANHWDYEMEVNKVHKRRLRSFCFNQWQNLGVHRSFWHKLPLELDMRNPEKEHDIYSELVDSKPYIVVNFSGISTPFPAHCTLPIMEGIAEYSVIDISHYRADRLDYLLGLLEGCACLLTVDTSILHLSYAAKCPTIALLCDGVCCRSARREHWYSSFTYTQAIKNPKLVVDSVKSLLSRNQSVGTTLRCAGSSNDTGEAIASEDSQ